MKIKFTSTEPALKHNEIWDDEGILRHSYLVEVTDLEFDS